MDSIDVHEQKPKYPIKISHAGVHSFETYLNLEGQNILARVTLLIDLPKDKRGIHISRLSESIIELRKSRSTSIEDFIEKLSHKVRSIHPFNRISVIVDAKLPFTTVTPISGRTSTELVDVRVSITEGNGGKNVKYRIKVVGNTVCPHALYNLKDKTHMQRAYVILEYIPGEKALSYKDLYKLVRNSFPSEVYNISKTPDETYVIEKMFSNPKFIEDVVREVYANVKRLDKGSLVNVYGISNESIHSFDIVACILDFSDEINVDIFK